MNSLEEEGRYMLTPFEEMQEEKKLIEESSAYVEQVKMELINTSEIIVTNIEKASNDSAIRNAISLFVQARNELKSHICFYQEADITKLLNAMSSFIETEKELKMCDFKEDNITKLLMDFYDQDKVEMLRNLSK